MNVRNLITLLSKYNGAAPVAVFVGSESYDIESVIGDEEDEYEREITLIVFHLPIRHAPDC